MKRLRKSLVRLLPPVTLFVDDVERIIEIMSKASTDPTFTVKTDEYSLEHAKQLENLKGEKVGKLKITLREPWISVEVEDDWVRLYAEEDSPVTRGILSEVKDLLRPRRRMLSIAETRSTFAVFLLLLLAGSLVSELGKGQWWGYGGYVFAAAGLVVVIRMFTVKSVIIPARRIERESFWQRNRDQIVVAALTAVLTFVATLLATWAAGLLRFSP